MSDIEAKVKEILKIDKNKIEIFDNIKNLNIDENFFNDSEKIKIMESIDESKMLEKAFNNIISKDSYFNLIYEKEKLCKYFIDFLLTNNLLVFLILYFLYNISIINFYNIIENRYIEKEKIENLIEKYNLYIFFVIFYAFSLRITPSILEKYYSYVYLFGFNSYVINFYKNYYNKKDNINLTLFTFSNLFNLMLQNIFSEKQGKDFLKVNAFFSVIDFLNFLFEFIIIDYIKLKENKLKIISIIISSIIQIFLLFALIINFIFLWRKLKHYPKNKIINTITKYI